MRLNSEVQNGREATTQIFLETIIIPVYDETIVYYSKYCAHLVQGLLKFNG